MTTVVEEKPLVLVADDEREVASLIAVVLNRAGVRAAIASNGEEALEIVAERKPDAAVIDIMMPNLNGYEVVKEIRERPGTRRMPVILLSARAGGIDRDYGLRIGADAYMLKPFNPKDLVGQLNELLANGRSSMV